MPSDLSDADKLRIFDKLIVPAFEAGSSGWHRSADRPNTILCDDGEVVATELTCLHSAKVAWALMRGSDAE